MFRLLCRKSLRISTILMGLGIYQFVLADDHIYQFGAPKLTKTATERARIHQRYPVGMAQFQNGIQIPAYGISIEDPMEDGLLKDFTSCKPKACSFNFKLDAAQAKKLTAYQVAGLGWFLAPNTWKIIEASMGPSGIAGLMMFSPDQTQYISMYDTSACVGCALTAASLFFKTAQKEAEKNEFWVYTSSNVALKKVPLNATTVLYSYQLAARYPSDGVAKFNGMQSDIVNFRQMTATLKPQDKRLKQAMLNFYLITQ